MFLHIYFNDLLIEKSKIERNKKLTKTFALSVKKKDLLIPCYISKYQKDHGKHFKENVCYRFQFYSTNHKKVNILLIFCFHLIYIVNM